MRLFSRRILLPLASILFLSACDQTTSTNSDDAFISTGSAVIPYGNPERATRTVPEDEKETQLQQYGLLRAELVDLLGQEDSALRKSSMVREFLERQAALPVAPYLEQFAGHRMLESLIAEPHVSTGEIAFYSRLLIKNENPDAEIIYRALRALSNTWTKSEIREASTATAERAVRWAGRVCPNCESVSGAKTAGNVSLENKRLSVLGAVDKLNGLVGP